MTDIELDALEKAANIAKGRSNEKDFFGMNSKLVIFYAMASPEAILELVQELRQARDVAKVSYGMIRDAVDRAAAKEATCQK